jgi:hypothetical protein
MDINFSDSTFIALASGISSATATLLLKPWIENRFHRNKLDIDFKAEQRKAIKTALAKYKVPLIKVCDEVNHRYWNFTENWSSAVYSPGGEYGKAEYHFKSYIYRVLAVFAWIKITEDNLIYLDTTIASKEEMDILKYFRLLRESLSSTQMYKNFDQKYLNSSDVFSRHQLDEMAEILINDNKVISFTAFEEKYTTILPAIRPFCVFLDGINPEEERLRWDRFQVFHFVLMAFLNKVGYDFQQVDKVILMQNNTRLRPNKLVKNLTEHVAYFRMGKDKEMAAVLKLIQA